MPISNLDPKVLSSLHPSEIANLALAADQERRRCLRAGKLEDAAAWDEENARLCAVFRGEQP